MKDISINYNELGEITEDILAIPKLGETYTAFKDNIITFDNLEHIKIMTEYKYDELPSHIVE